MDALTDVGFQMAEGVLLAVATFGIPWLWMKGSKLLGHKVSEGEKAKIRGFVRAGVLVASNEARRRVKGTSEDPNKESIEDFAIGKAKDFAKSAGSKLLDKYAPDALKDLVTSEYEEVRAEKANVKNLAGMISKMEETIAKIDAAPDLTDILKGRVRQNDAGEWVRVE